MHQVAGLALQFPAKGFKRREADRARFASFQDGQISECDADLLRELGQGFNSSSCSGVLMTKSADSRNLSVCSE